ncbi:hypothetical protein [Terrimonas sp.]|uniref:hypothetical protein n=1 Tax=Terrimonas sp. TaxID=1914338 RepID=UPI000E32B9D4|nr:hypothetical protein [Terrimonas sp.]
MMKLLAAILIFTSCTFKGALNKEPYTSLPSYPVSKNIEEAWKSTLAFFNSKNIPVVHAEKSSEYIITAPVPVQCGNEADSDADIIIADTGNLPSTATARYKVKVTQVYGQTTLIPTLEDIHTGDQSHAAKSTGKLEKILSEYVNK